MRIMPSYCTDNQRCAHFLMHSTFAYPAKAKLGPVFGVPAAETLGPTGDFEAIGARLYETRARLMVERNQGLTTTYNQLKDPACDDPEILALRRLHEDLDRAVLAAYRWSDVPVPPFETPTTPAARTAQESFEDEIIDRLFALNAERAEKEKLLGADAKGKGRSRARRGAKAPDLQMDLLPARPRKA